MAWATKDEARARWADAKSIPDVFLDDLLDAATTACRDFAPRLRRVLPDVVTTAGSTVITSATANFDETLDEGAMVVGLGIPADATITVVDEVTANLSAPATADGSGVSVTLTRPVSSGYRLATIYQAREVYSAGQRDGDVIGFGDYAIRSKPLTASVKALLRPQSGTPVVG